MGGKDGMRDPRFKVMHNGASTWCGSEFHDGAMQSMWDSFRDFAKKKHSRRIKISFCAIFSSCAILSSGD
jgi:hypothetical protein